MAADDLYNEKEQFNDAVEAALAYEYIYIYILFFGMRPINTIISDCNSSSSKVHSAGQSYQLVRQKKPNKGQQNENSVGKVKPKTKNNGDRNSYNMHLTFGP